MHDFMINQLHTIKNNKSLQIGLAVLSVAVVILVSMSINLDDAKDFIEANRNQAALIGVGLYALMGFTFIPSSPLTLFFAVFLGPFPAILIAAVGNTLAAILEYRIGNAAGDIFNFDDFRKKLPWGLGERPLTSPLLLLGARFLPVGKRGFSLVCGAYHVPMPRYLWTTAVIYTLDASILSFLGVSLVKIF